jgi:biopolymer transport protein TolR
MHLKTTNDTPFLSEINMVPFIDVALVLLIIFMIITPVMVMNSIQVQLPQSSSENQVPTNNIIVTVKPDGTIFLNNEQVTQGLLTDKIILLMEQHPECAVIYADRQVAVSLLVDVIDQIEAGGMHNISLTTDRRQQALPVTQGGPHGANNS